jgi:hypothetical protein
MGNPRRSRRGIARQEARDALPDAAAPHRSESASVTHTTPESDHSLEPADQSYRDASTLSEAQKEMIDFLIDMAIEEWLQNH